ncbi:pentatricopeptide repeat-containing protein At1g02060, chloroplastic-like [Cucurbita pepo subsp. pepo]|uniref:pentatricopeptide repeat-containing protein At1g02060, chloroplastic-like n=1 Tax=Cucurbita pepo subsp. pepo TaxID=3664 RepID=UPI000C9D689A|nr:pentatricopeptide repeat-containing protein At1g02060, chloroplastic-like [Cucurbita pepo subsp. pepo]
MAVARNRVLALAKGGSSRIPLRFQEAHYRCICRRFVSTDPSNSILNPQVLRLIQEPSSSVKSVLDSPENAFLGNSRLSWKALVTSLISSSSPKKAQLALEWRLEKMSKENERDPDFYIDLIRLCGELQNVPLAMRVFTAMEFQGVKPTVTAFNSLIEVCISSHNMITAFSMFEIMKNSESSKPNADTFFYFISAFAKRLDVNSMEAWYSAKRAFEFSADLRTYEALIHGSVKSKCFDFAVRCFDEMMLSGIVPNAIILDNMLEGFCKRKDLDELKKFLTVVLDKGWEINWNVVEKFIPIWFESGEAEGMEEILTKLNEAARL